MCTAWCPLSADWGTLADWANFVTAALVGLFVWLVSKRTADLAEAANKTNEALANLEHNRDQADKDIRDREQALILVSLSISLARTYSALKATLELLNDPNTFKLLLKIEEVREIVVATLERGIFEMPESTRSRIHFLDFDVAAKILRIEATVPVFLLSIRGIPSVGEAQRNINAETVRVGITEAMGFMLPVLGQCQTACRKAGIPFNAPQA